MISDAELLAFTNADAGDLVMLRDMERAAVEYVNEPGGAYFGVTANQVEVIRYRGGPIRLASEPTGDVVLEVEVSEGAWQAVTDFVRVGRMLYPRGGRCYTSPVFVRATYDAGYEVDQADADVWAAPELIRQAVRMLVAHWYLNRETVVVGTISSEVQMGVRDILRRFS
jgi:hypothetical protein